MKEDLASAIAQEIEKTGATSASIRPFAKSVRKGHLDDILEGRGDWYGLEFLTKIAEGLGLRFDFSVKGVTQ